METSKTVKQLRGRAPPGMNSLLSTNKSVQTDSPPESAGLLQELSSGFNRALTPVQALSRSHCALRGPQRTRVMKCFATCSVQENRFKPIPPGVRRTSFGTEQRFQPRSDPGSGAEQVSTAPCGSAARPPSGCCATRSPTRSAHLPVNPRQRVSRGADAQPAAPGDFGIGQEMVGVNRGEKIHPGFRRRGQNRHIRRMGDPIPVLQHFLKSRVAHDAQAAAQDQLFRSPCRSPFDMDLPIRAGSASTCSNL
jgi:hypothetical protein